MYLADCVIHLRYKAMEAENNRMLKIVKCRNSWHSEGFYPYRIISGLGLVAQSRNYKKKEKREAISALIKQLESNADALPEQIYKRMQRTFSQLSDTELGDITHEELMSYVLDEYS